MKSVTIVGLGYIGLPTAALLANVGYSVVGMDIDPTTVQTINQGDAHIAEPGLKTSVRKAVLSRKLRASEVLEPADIYLICVPTPLKDGAEHPSADVSQVMSAAKSISNLVKVGDLVILESTSPVGTTEVVQNVLRCEGVNVDMISIAYCPERVLPGKIMTELIDNDRIVGGLSQDATKNVAAFYRTFVKGNVIETDARTAEMCKLTENSYRDVNIAFANELSILCEKEGVDVWGLISFANQHPRVNILQPGAGVGGHCVAVDPWFLVARDPKNANLIGMARQVNEKKPKWIVEQIINRAAYLGTKKVVCLGISFKPDVGDLRESPALAVALELANRGYDVVAVEPNIKSHSDLPLLPLEQALDSPGVISVLVRHKQFFHPDTTQKLLEVQALDFCGVLA